MVDLTAIEIISINEILKKIIQFILINIWGPIRDYRFLLFGVLVLLVIIIVILWAKKHVPSRGRIIDVYDATGERIESKKNKSKNKKEEIHDLPKEFYKNNFRR